MLGKIQVEAIDNIVTMFSNIRINKFIVPVAEQLNIFMSYIHGHNVSHAIYSHPLSLLCVIKYVFDLKTQKQEEKLMNYYKKLLTEIPTFGFN